MSFPLVLCRDGVLRARDGVFNRVTRQHYPILLPVGAIEKERPGFFLSRIGQAFEMEEGLTVAELFANLEPWGHVVGPLARMDFAAFAAEAARPPAADACDDLDCFEIGADIEISALPEYERFPDGALMKFRRIPGSSFSEMLSTPPVVTDKASLDLRWSGLAVYKEPQDNGFGGVDRGCSVMGLPLDRWAHLPIRLRPTLTLTDATPDSAHLSDKGGLLRGDHPLVESHRSYDGSRIVRRSLEIEAPEPSFLEAVVQGLLWDVGFFGAPERRDAQTEELRLRLDRIDEDEAAAAEADAGEEGEIESFGLDDPDPAETAFSDESLDALARLHRLMREDPEGVKLPNGMPRGA